MRVEITKELLQGYRSKKDEILELDYILKNRWRDEGLIGNDVIFDYSKGYPMPQGVVGFDKEKYDRLQCGISDGRSSWSRNARKSRLLSKILMKA